MPSFQTSSGTVVRAQVKFFTLHSKYSHFHVALEVETHATSKTEKLEAQIMTNKTVDALQTVESNDNLKFYPWIRA